MASDRADRPAPRRGLVGRILGDRYRVTNLVSAGANTLVADADDLAVGRTVTIKLVRPDWAESAEFRRAFDREMRTVSALSHPNLAAVHDWGEETVGKRTTVYLVVEHLSGGSLRDLLDRGRSLDPSQALLVGLEACRGLDFAHRKHLVHTELTPSKLVFGDDRRLRIVDFGLARLLGELGWREPATLPTHVARYASPEQALEQPIGGKSDVYSLALILIEAVTRSVPFAARSTVATLSARIGRLMPVSADMGPLASLLERAGRPDPADRATAAQLGRGLVAAAAKLPRPKPIPILVSRPDEDPQHLRRPNDPTGGIARPRVERPAAVVPPVAAVPAPAAMPAPAPAPAPTPTEPTRYPEDDDDTAVAEAPGPSSDVVVEPSPVPPTTQDPAASPIPVEDAAAPAAPPVEPSATAATAAATVPVEAAAPAEPGTSTASAAPTEPTAPPVDEDPATPREPDPAPVPVLEEPPATDEPDLPSAPEESAAIAAVAATAPEPAPNPDLATLTQPPVETATGAPDANAAQDAPEQVPSRRLYDGDEDVTKDELAKLATAPPEEPAVVPPAAPGPPPPADVDEPPTRRRWVRALIGVVLLGALVGLAVLAYVLFQTPTHPVPDVEGQTLEEAEALIADFDWEVEVTSERSDEQPDEGSIIRTEPEAGKDLGEGEPFLIVISDGPEFRSLPELAGMTLADAETELARLRLTALVPTEAYDETVPAGSVISWSVPDAPELAAGGDVLPGTEVALVVSQGPTPRIVPEFTGMTVEEAETLLAADRLQIEVGAAVFSDTVPNGEIVSSTPVAGTAVPRDSTVVVVPSKGVDLVVVPDLSGMTLPQARQALTRAGLQVGTVIGNSQGRFAVATSQGEDLAAGARIKRNSAVDLAFI